MSQLRKIHSNVFVFPEMNLGILKNFVIHRYGNDLHWYVPSGSGSFFTGVGIASDNVHEMVWWQEEKLKPIETRLPKLMISL